VREVGIDYAQGYVIAKPAPFEISLQRHFSEMDREPLTDKNTALKLVSGK